MIKHMKKLRLNWGLFAFAALLTLASCQKEETIDPALDAEFTDAELQLEDLDALENTDVTHGSETAAFGMSHTAAAHDERHSLSFILPKLNLSERQKLAIRGFLKNHEACIAEHHGKIQQLHQELLKRANAIREDYIKAYRAGKISQRELEQKLAALREKVREEISKHEQRQLHLRVLRKCRMELITKIESVLDREQRQLWNRWKLSLQQR